MRRRRDGIEAVEAKSDANVFQKELPLTVWESWTRPYARANYGRTLTARIRSSNALTEAEKGKTLLADIKGAERPGY